MPRKKRLNLKSSKRKMRKHVFRPSFTMTAHTKTIMGKFDDWTVVVINPSLAMKKDSHLGR
jgi:hypothetical protein